MKDEQVSFCGHPVPTFGNKKTKVFRGLSFQTMFIFTHYRFVFEIRNRTDGRKGERKEGREGARRGKEEGRMDWRADGRTL